MKNTITTESLTVTYPPTAKNVHDTRFCKQPKLELEKHRETLKREVNRAIMLSAYSRRTMQETQALLKKSQQLTMRDVDSAAKPEQADLVAEVVDSPQNMSILRSLELHKNSLEILAKNKLLMERTASISRYKVDKDDFDQVFVKNIFCF